ncbi:hypothetical protein FKP32DRAFT_1117698 [Trametes sanguinea]|nr:hypothetical protein FKP32DRAFT_1117698 [Trametes sanguinea]
MVMSCRSPFGDQRPVTSPGHYGYRVCPQKNGVQEAFVPIHVTLPTSRCLELHENSTYLAETHGRLAILQIPDRTQPAPWTAICIDTQSTLQL